MQSEDLKFMYIFECLIIISNNACFKKCTVRVIIIYFEVFNE